MFLCSKAHRGLLLLNRMSCVDCKHAINALSHERCRTHAECANVGNTMALYATSVRAYGRGPGASLKTPGMARRAL